MPLRHIGVNDECAESSERLCPVSSVPSLAAEFVPLANML
jgi:hypothetical protein